MLIPCLLLKDRGSERLMQCYSGTPTCDNYLAMPLHCTPGPGPLLLPWEHDIQSYISKGI